MPFSYKGFKNMSFVEKNYKNGDTLFAKDLNNLVSGIKDANTNIALKINF